MKIEDLIKAWEKFKQLEDLQFYLNIAEESKGDIITKTSTVVLPISPITSKLISAVIIQEYKEQIAKIKKEIEEM